MSRQTTPFRSIANRTVAHCLAAAVAIGHAVAGEPTPVTLEAALRTALAIHPALRASAQAVAGGRAGVQGTAALPSPELVVAPAGTVDDSQIALLQSLEVTGQRQARTTAARARLSALEAQREAALREVAFGVRTAFYDAVAAQQEREVVPQPAELQRQQYEAAQKSFEAGDVPQSHVVRTRLELARAEQDLRMAEGEAAARRAALNAAMGRNAAESCVVQGDLPRPEAVPDAEALRAAAVRQRPELAAAQAEVRARESETRAARAALWPELVLEARRGSLWRTGGSLGLGITLPFLDWGRRRAETRQAQAALGEERARLDLQRNQVALDVEEALARLQAAATVVGHYESGILADAERLAAMTRTGYQEGALSYLEVIDAQRALLEARRGAIQARKAYANARAALDRAVGAPVPAH